MPESAQAPQKVCIRCQQDCSKKPRTRDEQGRYTCKACFDKAEAAKRLAAPPPTAAADVAVPADEAPGFSFADDLPAAVQPAPTGGGPCPECGAYLQAGTVLCTRCGHNTKTGKKAAIRTTTEVVDNESWREKRKREAAKASVKEYIKAAAVSAGGILAAGLVIVNQGGVEAFIGYLVILGIYAVAAAVVYVMCCMTWVGFDASLPLSLARIFAVCTIVALVYVVTLPIPFYMGRMALLSLVYAGVLTRLADIDFEDAIFIGALTGGVWILASITLVAALMSS